MHNTLSLKKHIREVKCPYLIAGISNRVLEPEHIHLTKPEYVMKISIDIFNPGICSPFVAVLSLASVLCIPIKLLCKDIVDKRLMVLSTCNINERVNADENNKMYLFWTSTDDRVDKLDHFVPLMNQLNPPSLKQSKYAKFMYLSQIHYWKVYLWILVKSGLHRKGKKVLVRKGKCIK